MTEERLVLAELLEKVGEIFCTWCEVGDIRRIGTWHGPSTK
jgi:hypothetical protein